MARIHDDGQRDPIDLLPIQAVERCCLGRLGLHHLLLLWLGRPGSGGVLGRRVDCCIGCRVVDVLAMAPGAWVQAEPGSIIPRSIGMGR